MVTRLTFLQHVGANALATSSLVTVDAVAAPALAPSQAAQKPNILFILKDNLRYEIGGSGVLRGSPAAPIDKLATEGCV